MKKRQHRHETSGLIAIAILLLAFRCVGEADSSPPSTAEVSLLGGWSYESAIFACFRQDHKAGFGDHRDEALAHTAIWDDSKGITFSDGKTGTWKIREDGKLEVYVEDCLVDCTPNPAIYSRDDSLGCGG